MPGAKVLLALEGGRRGEPERRKRPVIVLAALGAFTVAELIFPRRRQQVKKIRYTGGVPRKIPDGAVVVHNFAPSYPERDYGSGGFRVWLAYPEDGDIETPCDCGWQGIGPHFTRYTDRLEIR